MENKIDAATERELIEHRILKKCSCAEPAPVIELIMPNFEENHYTNSSGNVWHTTKLISELIYISNPTYFN